MDSVSVAVLLDEAFRIVRNYPVAYHSRQYVLAEIARQMSSRHTVSLLPDKTLLIDGARVAVRRRGRDSIYEVRCWG